MVKKAIKRPPSEKKLDYTKPTTPIKASDHIIASFQQLREGTANEGQQQDALAWIVEILCRTHDLSYRPESERDTIFAEGKRFVGLQIISLLKSKLGGNP